jgi:hypothetical protein
MPTRTSRSLAAPLVLLALLAPAVTATGAPRRGAAMQELLRSHELWATVDVCDTAKQPDTVGVRGSMPGDGHAHDEMLMSFHLQYLNAVNQWVEIATGTSSAFIDVGGAGATRQGGSSFMLKPRASKATYTLRGVVDFKWMRGATVVHTAHRYTSAGHQATDGAEPKGFSAAQCSVG